MEALGATSGLGNDALIPNTKLTTIEWYKV